MRISPFGIFLIVLCSALLILVSIVIVNELGRETKYIEGVVIDYEIVKEPNFLGGTNDFLVLTFDNNETYKFHMDEDMYDFTVNSKLILRISKGGLSKSWGIIKMIRVPDTEVE
jgi:hypothetical protein